MALQIAYASLNVVTYPGLMFGAVRLLNCLLHPPFVLEETCPVSVCVRVSLCPLKYITHTLILSRHISRVSLNVVRLNEELKKQLRGNCV